MHFPFIQRSGKAKLYAQTVSPTSNWRESYAKQILVEVHYQKKKNTYFLLPRLEFSLTSPVLFRWM